MRLEGGSGSGQGQFLTRIVAQYQASYPAILDIATARIKEKMQAMSLAEPIRMAAIITNGISFL
jgi:hypothetical protein